MRENLELSHGAIFGEYAMMRLGETLGKHRGHELVHEAAVAAATGKGAFLDEIGKLPGGAALSADISNKLTQDGASGICKEYALHYGALVEHIGAGPLPTVEQRSIGAYLKTASP
jgi:adenylosuccinate lyase